MLLNIHANLYLNNFSVLVILQHYIGMCTRAFMFAYICAHTHTTHTCMSVLIAFYLFIPLLMKIPQ